MKKFLVLLVAGFSVGILGMVEPNTAFAHCDGLDGPVVEAAQRALDSGNPNLVLIWVQKRDEKEIRAAFEKTLAVRKYGSQARELADLYFFETLVRIHRAGEGEPYTGLKPSGRNLGPAIPAADKALESREIEPLLKLITEETRRAIRDRYEDVLAKKHYRPNDVEAGREYVEAYVLLLEQVERIYEAANSPARGHIEKTGKTELHKEEKH